MFETSLTWPIAAAAVIVGYLLGSIPFGLVLTRAAGLGDVRAIGSGNIGATNVLRTGNKKLAAATLALDLLKGTLAVVLARLASGVDAGMVAGCAAFLGHLFPVWLRFKGGKGVATYIGVLLGLVWPAVLIFAGVWVAVAYFSRYSSAGALAATLAVPASLWLMGEPRLALLFALLTLITWVKHRGNIKRLVAGTEGRIGDKK
jgi:acyl phosphate:glycerol-3-phosphate acyltransferase